MLPPSLVACCWHVSAGTVAFSIPWVVGCFLAGFLAVSLLSAAAYAANP